MLSLAFTLLLLAAQPDDGPVATQQVVPPPSAAALAQAQRQADAQKAIDEARRRKDEEAADAALLDWADGKQPAMVSPAQAGRINWDIHPTQKGADLRNGPQTEEQKRAAANAAALERAEQAGRDANAPPGEWPDDGKMRCQPTDSGFVCGNSDAALAPDSPSRQALDDLLKPD
ncbi:MAG: hypothetical protein Q7T61_14325 [Caulobacter sp.]|nr:hypothetical protein [Caulobacter sp.]